MNLTLNINSSKKNRSIKASQFFLTGSTKSIKKIKNIEIQHYIVKLSQKNRSIKASQFFLDISTKKKYLSYITCKGRQNCTTQEIIVKIRNKNKNGTQNQQFFSFISFNIQSFTIPAIRQRYYKTKRKEIKNKEIIK